MLIFQHSQQNWGFTLRPGTCREDNHDLCCCSVLLDTQWIFKMLIKGEKLEWKRGEICLYLSNKNASKDRTSGKAQTFVFWEMAAVSPGRLFKNSFTQNCLPKNWEGYIPEEGQGQNDLLFLQFEFALLFQIDKHFLKGFKLQKYFPKQNMQVVAGQNNSSANKLQLKKMDCFGLLSSKNQLWQKYCILCDDAATESHVMFLNQHTTDLQTFREKIIQTGLSQTHLQVFVSKFWKMNEH